VTQHNCRFQFKYAALQPRILLTKFACCAKPRNGPNTARLRTYTSRGQKWAGRLAGRVRETPLSPGPPFLIHSGGGYTLKGRPARKRSTKRPSSAAGPDQIYLDGFEKYLAQFEPGTDVEKLKRQIAELDQDIQCLTHPTTTPHVACFRCGWNILFEQWRPPFHSRFPGMLVGFEEDKLFQKREELKARIQALQSGRNALIENLLQLGKRKQAVDVWKNNTRLDKELYAAANVDRSDFYAWRREEWPTGSAIDRRLRGILLK